MATTTNQSDFILKYCVDNEGEVPNTMAQVLEMAMPISFVMCQQMVKGVLDIM